MKIIQILSISEKEARALKIKNNQLEAIKQRKAKKNSKIVKKSVAKKSTSKIGKSWVSNVEVGDTVEDRFDGTLHIITKSEIGSINNIPNVHIIYFEDDPESPNVAIHYNIKYKNDNPLIADTKPKGKEFDLGDIVF